MKKKKGGILRHRKTDEDLAGLQHKAHLSLMESERKTNRCEKKRETVMQAKTKIENNVSNPKASQRQQKIQAAAVTQYPTVL